MGTGKDKKQRKRRNKTDAEKQETLRKKNAERQRKDQAKYGSVAGFFSTPREVSVAGGADVNTITGGDDVELITHDATGSDEVLMRNDSEPEVADDYCEKFSRVTTPILREYLCTTKEQERMVHCTRTSMALI